MFCVQGTCHADPVSCSALEATCRRPDGDGNESCCASNPVTGGSFNRNNEPALPATVSDFLLDRYEVTVGRFRAFVAAYPGSRPADGAGEHPKIAGSGWNAARWDGLLPATREDLSKHVRRCGSKSTWTAAPASNETLPMNCLSWYEAFAFCVWDGGRLPTEAEWNYAAAGGSEQREFPWGAAPVDQDHAVYDCTGDGSAPDGCAAGDILSVGSKSPVGDGRWGQADLSGSLWEWTLDYYPIAVDLPAECHDCANLSGDSLRVMRGGAWNGEAGEVTSSYRYFNEPDLRRGAIDFFGDFLGVRCARTP
jgi:formylglycine-generating enzyme